MVVADAPEQRLRLRIESELDALEQQFGTEAREIFTSVYLHRGIRDTTISMPKGSDLSERERFVLVQYALGRRMKDLSRELGLSVRTIETYLTRGQRKLGVHGRAQVVRLVLGRGWLTDLAT